MALEGAATQDTENWCGALMGQRGPSRLAPQKETQAQGRLSIWILHQRKGSFSYSITQIFILYIGCVTLQESSS